MWGYWIWYLNEKGHKVSKLVWSSSEEKARAKFEKKWPQYTIINTY